MLTRNETLELIRSGRTNLMLYLTALSEDRPAVYFLDEELRDTDPDLIDALLFYGFVKFRTFADHMTSMGQPNANPK